MSSLLSILPPPINHTNMDSESVAQDLQNLSIHKSNQQSKTSTSKTSTSKTSSHNNTSSHNKTSSKTSSNTSSNTSPHNTTPTTSSNTPSKNVPKYPNRINQKFIPRTQSDFCDGGAYPELRLAQYPLGMGRKQSNVSNQLVLAKNTTNTLARHNSSLPPSQQSKQIVYSKYTDLIEADVDEKDLQRPSEDSEDQLALETKKALEKKLQTNVSTAYNNSIQHQNDREQQITFIKYTPIPRDPNSKPKTRIIRIVEEERDPMEPPRFKSKKNPIRTSTQTPVPILRPPPKKLTKEDMENFNIPKVISNWKNNQGNIIALDKRMIAEGSNLKQTLINDRFADLTQTLIETERQEREAIAKRKEYQQAVERRLQQQEDERMRQLAEEAKRQKQMINVKDEPEYKDFMQREQVRRQLKKDIEDEERKEKLKRKKSSYQNDDDRDVSERVALGKHVVSEDTAGSHVDIGLQDHGMGLGQGFGAEDDYNVYDRPLVSRSQIDTLYRPRQETIDAYSGDVEQIAQASRNRFTKEPQRQSDQVVFERANVKDEELESDNEVNVGEKRKRNDPFSHIGQRGFMQASAGSSNDLDHYRQSKRSKVDFVSSSKKYE